MCTHYYNVLSNCVLITLLLCVLITLLHCCCYPRCFLTRLSPVSPRDISSEPQHARRSVVGGALGTTASRAGVFAPPASPVGGAHAQAGGVVRPSRDAFHPPRRNLHHSD